MSDDNRRTPEGALLRAGLEHIARIPIPEGRQGRAAVVTDGAGVGVGVAWLTPQGWRIDVTVSAALRDGRSLIAAGSIEW